MHGPPLTIAVDGQTACIVKAGISGGGQQQIRGINPSTCLPGGAVEEIFDNKHRVRVGVQP